MFVLLYYLLKRERAKKMFARGLAFKEEVMYVAGPPYRSYHRATAGLTLDLVIELGIPKGFVPVYWTGCASNRYQFSANSVNRMGMAMIRLAVY